MSEARINKIETGVCWTCKHVCFGRGEDGYDGGWWCENPDIPETAIGEDTPDEKWGYDSDHPCPYWQGEIDICVKHGEYLKREGCIECGLYDAALEEIYGKRASKGEKHGAT